MRSNPLSALRNIFVGPNGLRAGSRLALFVANGAVFWLLLKTAVRFITPGGRGLGMALGAEVSLVAAVLAAAAVMARIEGRSFAEYGLPARGAFGSHFWLGALWGFAALSLLLLLMRLGGGFDFGTLALRGPEIVGYGAYWAAVFLAAGFFEEFLFRGYALSTLAGAMGFWPAAVLLSVLFGGLHLRNPGETWAGALSAVVVGVFFCLTLRRTGSLWFAVGLHAAWDYAESFLYSVPDSGNMVPGHLIHSSFHGPNWLTGGTVGPEGSVLVFVMIAAMFVVFDRLHRGVRFPLAPSHAPSAALEAPPHGQRTTDD